MTVAACAKHSVPIVTVSWMSPAAAFAAEASNHFLAFTTRIQLPGLFRLSRTFWFRAAPRGVCPGGASLPAKMMSYFFCWVLSEPCPCEGDLSASRVLSHTSSILVSSSVWH